MRGSWLCALAAMCAAVALAQDSEQGATGHKSETLANNLTIEYMYTLDGCEPKSKIKDILSMHYNGMFKNGTTFDSNLDTDEPFIFELGVGEVIDGWDLGLTEMCVCEKRRLTIPPNLAYGDKGAGNVIPGKTTLVFDVELLNICNQTLAKNNFEYIDQDQDKQISIDEVSIYLKQLSDYKEVVEDIFNHDDKDKDGLISQDEFTGYKLC